MTLNITLVTADRIFQSSDFMLTIPSPYEVVSTSSTKIVQFQYEDAVGFVSITGIGRWPRRDYKDTARRVAEWLDGRQNLTFDDVAEAIRSKGDEFLRRVEIANGRRCHTFTVAGFDKGVAAVALVSNFESVSGHTNAHPSAKLRTTKKHYRNSAFVVVTGERSAVDRNRRKQLARLGKGANINPNQVRELLARVNLLAARAVVGNPTVSEECSVFSIDATGAGVHELTPGSRIDPISVTNGAILPRWTEIARMIGIDPASMVFAGATFATSDSDQAEAPACTPALVEGNAPYFVEDISIPGMAESNPLAVGRYLGEFAVAGICSAPESRGRYSYWIWTPSLGHNFLPAEGENTGNILFLEDESVVVAANVEGRVDVLRFDGERTVAFDKRGCYDSGCRGVNNSGQIGGWIGGISAQDRGQHTWRPVVWNSDGNVIDMLDGERLNGADWGYVLQILDEKALVVAYVGHYPTALIWHIGGAVEVLAEPADHIVAVGIFEDTILGFVKEKAQPVAVVRTAKGAWSRLGTDDGWTPLVYGANGAIGGRAIRNGFSKPAIWNHGESLLSDYMFHNTDITYIAGTGEILGRAGADHGSHALLWRPK